MPFLAFKIFITLKFVLQPVLTFLKRPFALFKKSKSQSLSHGSKQTHTNANTQPHKHTHKHTHTHKQIFSINSSYLHTLEHKVEK